VELTRDGDVFVLRLGDGENRMNAGFVEEWNERIDAVCASAGSAALVTTGTGKHYSNGLDLEWLGGCSADDTRVFFRELFATWARLLTLPMVTVAAVNGHAFGAGALLSLAHDRRVMREDRGWWCMPEADHGWSLYAGMTGMLAHRLPVQTAHEAIVLARRFTGPEAESAGIVQAVAPEGQVLTVATGWAAEHAPKRHESLSLLKATRYADLVDLLATDRALG
jgi:enoyl-CoA hydratase/carnithine racemase